MQTFLLHPHLTQHSFPSNMPKSKRAKVTTLSKTPLRSTKSSKAALVNQLRAAIDQYDHVWLFSVGDMRNEGLKEVRSQWRGSGRFFFGKGKVMAKALGETPETEYQQGLHQLAQVSPCVVDIFLHVIELDQAFAGPGWFIHDLTPS